MFDYYRDPDNRISLEEMNGAPDIDPLDMPAVRAEACIVLDALADEMDERAACRADPGSEPGRQGLQAQRHAECQQNRRPVGMSTADAGAAHHQAERLRSGYEFMKINP